jgi:hypothetical protein
MRPRPSVIRRPRARPRFAPVSSAGPAHEFRDPGASSSRRAARSAEGCPADRPEGGGARCLRAPCWPSSPPSWTSRPGRRRSTPARISTSPGRTRSRASTAGRSSRSKSGSGPTPAVRLSSVAEVRPLSIRSLAHDRGGGGLAAELRGDRAGPVGAFAELGHCTPIAALLVGGAPGCHGRARPGAVSTVSTAGAITADLPRPSFPMRRSHKCLAPSRAQGSAQTFSGSGRAANGTRHSLDAARNAVSIRRPVPAPVAAESAPAPRGGWPAAFSTMGSAGIEPATSRV